MKILLWKNATYYRNALLITSYFAAFILYVVIDHIVPAIKEKIREEVAEQAMHPGGRMHGEDMSQRGMSGGGMQPYSQSNKMDDPTSMCLNTLNYAPDTAEITNFMKAVQEIYASKFPYV